MKHVRDFPVSGQRMVPVISAAYPFYAKEARRYCVQEGMTLAQIAALSPDIPPGFFETGIIDVVVMDRRGRKIESAEYPALDENGRAVWPRVRPRAATKSGHQVHVVLRSPLNNGGGGQGASNPAQIVALIAVVALSFAVSAGAFNSLIPELAGSFQIGAGSVATAKIAGAAIALTGLLAVAALSKSPSVPNIKQPKQAQQRTAGLQGNQLSPGTQLPRVCGTKRISPPCIIEPFLEDVGDDQYAECIYGLAGPHKIGDVRADMLPLSQVIQSQLIIRQGIHTDPLFKGFNDARDSTKKVLRYAHTETPNIEMSHHLEGNSAENHTGLFDKGNTAYYRYFETPKLNPLQQCPHWHSFTKTIDCDETHVTLSWPGGSVWGDSSVTHLVGIPFRMRCRRYDDSGIPGDWKNFPEFWFARIRGAGFNRTIKLFWRAPTSDEAVLPTPPTDNATDKGAIYAFTQVPSCGYATKDQKQQQFDGWTADTNFMSANPTKANRLYSADTVGTTNAKNMGLYDDRVEFFLPPSTFPSGTYEFQIVRGIELRVGPPDSSNIGFFPASYARSNTQGSNAAAVNTFFGYHPTIPDIPNVPNSGSKYPVFPRDTSPAYATVSISRIAHVINEQPSPSRDVCIIAVKVKNQNLGAITAMCSGLVPDWDGSAWSGLHVSKNPAPHCRDILAGSLNLTPVGAESIDDDDFVAFRTACIGSGSATSPQYQVNAEITGGSVPQNFDLVAGCGLGGGRFAEKFGVLAERDRSGDGVVQTFTPFSSRQFSASKGFPPLPDGLRVTFSDSSNNYLDSTIFVYADGINSSQNIQEIRYEGLVTPAEARRRAKFDLRYPRLRPTIYTINVPAQYVYCRKGDLIGLQHDVLVTKAAFARLVSKSVSGGNITSIVVNNPLTAALTGGDPANIPASNFPHSRFGVSIETRDSVVSTHQATLSSDGLTVTFVTPFANDADITTGVQITGGSVGKEYIRLVVSSITPKPDNTADIAAFAEANGLFNA